MYSWLGAWVYVKTGVHVEESYHGLVYVLSKFLAFAWGPREKSVWRFRHFILCGGQDSSVGYLLQDGFFLGLFFHPEDEGDMFLRNIGYTALYPSK
jgi:hypothetical protein